MRILTVLCQKGLAATYFLPQVAGLQAASYLLLVLFFLISFLSSLSLTMLPCADW